MCFLSLHEEDQQRFVVTMLGLSPNHPESWPKETVDRIIRKAERAAELSLQEDVAVLLARRS